jgi:hypothetical protein
MTDGDFPMLRINMDSFDLLVFIVPYTITYGLGCAEEVLKSGRFSFSALDVDNGIESQFCNDENFAGVADPYSSIVFESITHELFLKMIFFIGFNDLASTPGESRFFRNNSKASI